ncbi:right-handed parallel beta-helix repeat-containing protein, partial [Candidatus Pacearchaeota archaeon]|nr:right-handed parallel beta-helix repeat-containing protein [Candidatus Pacearchaeota archaeon]
TDTDRCCDGVCELNAYYVAKNGNDSNLGTEDQPWLTIQKSADTMTAGDTVYIMAGNYNERVWLKNSGSVDNYITYTAYPGDTVTIDGTGIPLPNWYGLFDVSDKSYIKVSGLRVINSAYAGIFVDGSHHIVIEKNYVYNTVSSGIAAWYSDNIIIDGNEVELACNDGEQECITIAITDTFEVKNNHVHHGGPGTNGGEGIDVKDGSSNGKVYKNHVHDLTDRIGMYTDAWDSHTYNIDVYQNIVHHCIAGIDLASEAGGLLENVNIYNNLFYDNEECGIRFGDWSSAREHPVKNIKVINNNLYNNGLGIWGGGIAIDNSDAEDIVIRNNIVSQNADFQILVSVSIPNLTVDHNLIDDYRGYWGEIYGDDYVEGDPLFVNPSEADFHLQADSPAIDNGTDVGLTSDFEGNPIVGLPDIGAYEYQF